MTFASGLLLNGVFIATLGPLVLERVTGRLSAGAAIIGWSAAMVAVLLSWLTATVLAGVALLRSDGHLHPLLAECLSGLETLLDGRYDGAVQLGLIGLIAVSVLLATILLGRLVVVLARSRSRTHQHCRTAHLVGEPYPGTEGALLLERPERCVYCVTGRPAAIVITRGALDVLDNKQLAAVLAHERAHLTERHHFVIAASRSAAAVLPRLRLFTAGADALTRLVEIRADDVARRRHSSTALVGALLALSDTRPIRATALGASGVSVVERVERLLLPVGAGPSAPRLSMGLSMATLLTGPALTLFLLTTTAALCQTAFG